MGFVGMFFVFLLFVLFIPGLALLIAGIAKRRKGLIIAGAVLCAPLLLLLAATLIATTFNLMV